MFRIIIFCIYYERVNVLHVVNKTGHLLCWSLCTSSFNTYSAKSLGDRLYATLHKMPGEIGNSICLFLKT